MTIGSAYLLIIIVMAIVAICGGAWLMRDRTSRKRWPGDLP